MLRKLSILMPLMAIVCVPEIGRSQADRVGMAIRLLSCSAATRMSSLLTTAHRGRPSMAG